MDTVFFHLHDFMLHTKSWAYILMGIGLVGFICYWLFLNGRDEKIKKF